MGFFQSRLVDDCDNVDLLPSHWEWSEVLDFTESRLAILQYRRRLDEQRYHQIADARLKKLVAQMRQRTQTISPKSEEVPIPTPKRRRRFVFHVGPQQRSMRASFGRRR